MCGAQATTTTLRLRTTAYNISLPPLPLTSFTLLSFRMASSGSIGRGVNALSVVEQLGEPSVLLEVRDLKARMKKSGQEILHGVNLIIKEGETHVIIGKYGSGKSIFLQYLEADLAILDEIDSTSSYDALVAKALNVFLTSKKSALIITHHLGLLDHISPNFVHIMENGKISKTVNTWIAKQLEKAHYFVLRPPFY